MSDEETKEGTEEEMSEVKKGLAGFITSALDGTLKAGMNLLPLLAAYALHRHDDDWKTAGFTAWLQNDPKAIEVLTGALRSAKAFLPEEAKAMIILALQDTEV